VLNCTAAAHKVFPLTHTNDSMHDYIADQTAHCSCSSMGPDSLWMSTATNKFRNLLSTLCDSQFGGIFESPQQCREKSISLLLEMTLSKEAKEQTENQVKEVKSLKTLISVV